MPMHAKPSRGSVIAAVLSLALSATPASGQQLRVSIDAPDSDLREALVADLLSADLEAAGIAVEVVSQNVPGLVALDEGIVDVAYVPLPAAQERALAPVGFSDLMRQAFTGIQPRELASISGSIYRDYMLADIEQDGTFGLSFAAFGTSNLLAHAPIEGMEDVEGQKWAVLNPPAFDALVLPLPMPPRAEAVATLATGAADAVEFAYSDDLVATFDELGEAAVLTDLQPVILVALVTVNYWEKLTTSQRNVIGTVLDRAERNSIDRSAEAAETLAERLAERGVMQLASFSEVLGEDSVAVLRDAWIERGAMHARVLELFEEISRDAARQPQQAPDSPEPTERQGGELIDRRIWFATDRVHLPWNDRFDEKFGVYQETGAERWWCGSITWDGDHGRQAGTLIESGLSLDGQVVAQDECSNLLAGLAARDDRIMIFIHGFNVEFHEAAGRAAALVEDTGWPHPLAVWSWPSMGQEEAYKTDENRIKSSWNWLSQYLQQVGDAGFRRIDVLSHSMGGRLGLRVLERVDTTGARDYHNNIFVAPDEDRATFDGAIATRDYPGRVVLYANAHDQPLIYSAVLNGGPRAGLGGPERLVMEGLETVDVSPIDNERGEDNHSHAFDVAEGLRDLAELLNNDTLPGAPERNLAREPDDGPPFYWVIERDPQRRAGRE